MDSNQPVNYTRTIKYFLWLLVISLQASSAAPLAPYMNGSAGANTVTLRRSDLQYGLQILEIRLATSGNVEMLLNTNSFVPKSNLAAGIKRVRLGLFQAANAKSIQEIIQLTREIEDVQEYPGEGVPPFAKTGSPHDEQLFVNGTALPRQHSFYKNLRNLVIQAAQADIWKGLSGAEVALDAAIKGKLPTVKLNSFDKTKHFATPICKSSNVTTICTIENLGIAYF